VRLLILNYGSSNLKYALWENDRFSERKKVGFSTEKDLREILKEIKNKNEGLKAILHRVVHGGDLKEPTLITEKIKEKIKEMLPFSPIHNKYALIGIEIFESLNIPQIAIFDTAFHSTIPEYAKIYPLPYSLYKKGIKRYGFHGISYSFVLDKLKEILRKESPNAILLHLGGGCSICAVKEGKSIDTSMGLTPLEGLMMRARSGDIDPGFILYMLKEGKSPEEVENLLTKKSGFLGLTETGDVNLIVERFKKGDKKAEIALKVFTYRIKKYIGAYFAILKDIEAITFSGGIGENSPLIREMICEDLDHLGIKIDKEKNRRNEFEISSGKIRIFVVKTDEELQMVKTLAKGKLWTLILS